MNYHSLPELLSTLSVPPLWLQPVEVLTLTICDGLTTVAHFSKYCEPRTLSEKIPTLESTISSFLAVL